MSNNDKWDTIKRALYKLQNDRMNESIKLMKEYDEKVYYPEMRKIIELCAETGHQEGDYDNNGLGWTFFHCKWCGTMMRSIDPDGKEENELEGKTDK